MNKVEVADIRGVFKPEELSALIDFRTQKEAWEQASIVAEEVKSKTDLVQNRGGAVHLSTYNAEAVAYQRLSLQKQWEVFEYHVRPYPSRYDIDDYEMRRLLKGRTRVYVLRDLGFQFVTRPPFSSVIAKWGASQIGAISYLVTPVPKQEHMYLARTMQPRPNFRNLLTENLVAASDEETLRSFWQAKMRKNSPAAAYGTPVPYR